MNGAYLYFLRGVIQGVLQGGQSETALRSAQEAGCVLPKRIKATASAMHDPTFLLRLAQAGYFSASNAQVP